MSSYNVGKVDITMYNNDSLRYEVHLQPFRYNWGCDELVGGHFLVQLVIGALVKQHQVVQLIPARVSLCLKKRCNSWLQLICSILWQSGSDLCWCYVNANLPKVNHLSYWPSFTLGPLLLLGLAPTSLFLLGSLAWRLSILLWVLLGTHTQVFSED